MVADKRGLSLPRSTGDTMFSRTAWILKLEESTAKFEKHQNTNSHHEAVQLVITIPRRNMDVGEMLSESHAEQKAENRQCLK